jgi:hypothetical protein
MTGMFVPSSVTIVSLPEHHYSRENPCLFNIARRSVQFCTVGQDLPRLKRIVPKIPPTNLCKAAGLSPKSLLRVPMARRLLAPLNPADWGGAEAPPQSCRVSLSQKP